MNLITTYLIMGTCAVGIVISQFSQDGILGNIEQKCAIDSLQSMQKKSRSEPAPDAPGILFIDLFNGKSNIPDTLNWKLCDYANNAWSQHFKNVE